MLRYTIILLLIHSSALAQNHFCGKQIISGSGGGVEYPFDTSGLFNTAGAKFWINFSQDPSSSPITDGTGDYQFVVNGTPVRRFDGTYPAGIGGTEGYRWDHDSTSDGLTRADDGSLDFTTQFTLVVVTTNLDISSGAGNLWLRKKSSTPDMGYRLYMFIDDVYFNTYNTTTTTIQKNNVGLAGKVNCAVATMDGTGGVGSSTSYLYVDEYSSSTSSTMNPVGAAPGVPTQIHMPSSKSGIMHYAAYYSDAAWTEAQSRSFCRNFYGLMSNDGNHVSVTSSSPAATYLTTTGAPSYLVSTSADTAIIGAYGFYAHPDIDNLVQRQSFESWPTWDETTVAGDGSATVAQVSTATSAHGYSHISMSLAGTTSSATVHSACVTSGISADLYVQVQAKKTAGTTSSAVRIHEYSDASCSTSISTTDIRAAGDVTSDWAEYGGKFAAASWNGPTAGWKIEIHETCNGGCISHFDAVQAASRAEATDSYCVTCDTDATCSCTASISTIPQPLTAQGWKITATIRSPIDGASATPVRNILTVPGTAGNNNRIDLYWASDTLTLDVYDSSGTKITATQTAAGNADTDYSIEATHTAAGVITACWAGSCGTPAVAATMGGISATCRIGNNGTLGSDMWIRNLKVDPL